MRSKILKLHPLLIILAVALASVLFVAACGDDAEPTAAPVDSQAAAEEAAAAAAAQVAAAEAAAEAAQAAAAAEVTAAEAATAKAIADAEAQASASAAELAEVSKKFELAAAGQVAAEAEVAAAAALLAAEGQPKYGGTLRVTLAPNFTGMDPVYSVGEVGQMIHQQAYDNLLMIQPDLSVKPELATSWEANDDFTSYTFHLREGVKFHHGKDFKAEDVVFNF